MQMAMAQQQNRHVAGKIVAERISTDTLKTAMLAAMSRHPEADRWSGVDDKQIFGISVVSFTDRDVKDGDVGMFRTTARLLATKEMLFAKVLLDKYAETGLTDAGSLREAVAQANESFSVRGKITFDIEEAVIEGNRIVGIAVADRKKVVATMTEQTRIDAVRSAYRDVVHRQARRLIAGKKYEEALNTLLELRQANLLGREQLFEVLGCFVGMNKPADAEKIVGNLIEGCSDDVKVFRRLVTLTAAGESDEFRRLTDKLQAEINRLDPPEQNAEQVLNQLLNELMRSSSVQ
jgi:hypothetical protein